jgi:broad-specificity NMP kinase
MKDYAEENNCLGEIGKDGAAEIDVEKLSATWINPAELTLLDGHLAHYIPVDALIVVRCEPNELGVRLANRGYSEEKIRANVEVEMLGGPWNDLLDDVRPIYEGTEVEAWISAGCPHHTTPDMAIDWLSEP